ncbi:MAG: M14 family metallopeptidase [Bacillota bacterium]|nr:M14 family metallopeptidase [Bacillota bacterium]
MTDIQFDRYLKYDELTGYLQAVAAAYPHLATLGSIGKSYEGRELWLLTLTNSATGGHETKPAMYVDGNIHAGEVTASMTCLYAIDHLVRNFGKDERVTRLLDRRTFYVVPRVNPDGAEKYLTTPSMLRSSVRVWPDERHSELPGLHPSDVDGNGQILEMRVRDDDRGEWRVSAKDPRVMVARGPDDVGGPYYHIYPEGHVQDHQGPPFAVRSVPWGLDINRTYPSNWRPELRGGGDYPAQEPEVRSEVGFIISRPNIGGLLAFHTSGGILFRNPYQYTDAEMDPDDLRATLEIAVLGTEDSGYPEVASGRGYSATMVEWAYEHRGMIAFTPELWDMYGRAGLSRAEAAAAKTREQREAIELKLLQWNDRELAGKGFVPWTAFEHPQLGAVEIGGWSSKFVRQNPPPKFLEQECHKNALFVLRHAAALPEVDVSDVKVERVGATSAYRVTALVINRGYLPTNITNRGKKVGVVKPDTVRIELGEGMRLISGKAEQEIGFLEGYMAGQRPGWGRGEPAKSAARVEWVVQADGGDPEARNVCVEISSGRGGCARRQALLPSC